MKKTLSIILMLLLLLSMSCSKNNVEQNTILGKFNIDKAIKTVDDYMIAVMKNDVNLQNKLYSSKLKKISNTKNRENLIVNGYKFDEITQAGDMGIMQVKVSEINSNVPYASLKTETFKVIKEDNSYRIKGIDTQNEKELFVSGINNDQIRLRTKNNVKTNLVTNFDGMPKYYYNQDDKTKNEKIPISMDEFGLVGLSYDGNSGFITTKGKNPYIEIVNFDESMATQGGVSGQGQGGSTSGAGTGSGTGSGGGSTENDIVPEKPIGKEIVSLDVIPNAIIKNSIYSLNNRYLVIQYAKNNSGNTLKMYKCKDGDDIPFDFEKNYPIDKVDLTIINFVKNGLIYRVTPRAAYVNDKSLKNIVGTWQIDTDEFKVKSVNEAKANTSQ